MNKAEVEANEKGKQLFQEEKRRKEIEAENTQNLNKLRQAEK